MSLGSLGPVAGAAGTSAAQSRGSDVERAQQDTVQIERRAASAEKAANAAGVGATDQEHEASERDADGRRPWEDQRRAKAGDETPELPPDRKSRDATGQSGTQLDLTG